MVQSVMIVEDDFIMGLEVGEFMESLGIEVRKVTSTGEEAVENARLLEPELVLMDIRLKGKMNGIEAADRIRGFSIVPIIFLTGYKDNHTREAAEKIKNSYFVTKPFSPDDLAKVIQEMK